METLAQTINDNVGTVAQAVSDVGTSYIHYYTIGGFISSLFGYALAFYFFYKSFQLAAHLLTSPRSILIEENEHERMKNIEAISAANNRVANLTSMLFEINKNQMILKEAFMADREHYHTYYKNMCRFIAEQKENK